MKRLKNFTSFDYDSFAKGKTFAYMGCREAKEKDTGKDYLAIELVIMQDKTIYGKDKDGNDVVGVNDLEKFNVKMYGGKKADFDKLQPHTNVRIENVEKATIFQVSEKNPYEHNLSVVGKVVVK